MDSRKPLTAREIEELQATAFFVHGLGGMLNESEVAALCAAIPRILSMLPPPPDAALREAASRLDRSLGYGRYAHVTAEDINTLLSYVRAVQAPRPSREQHRVVRIAVINADLRGDTEESEALREAFPGAFAGEVGE